MNAVTMTRAQREFLGFCNDARKYVDHAIAGQDVFGFIGGRFSLIDAIDACVQRVPDCKLTVSTWTAARADMDHVLAFIDDGRISATRWIVDRSFQNRQPQLCQYLRDRFGDDAIRVQPVHCKFALIENAEHKLTLQTSANLNENRRLENLNLSTCPVFFDAYSGLVEQIFDVQPPAEGFEDPSSPNRAFKQLTLGSTSWIDQKLQRKQDRFQRKLKKLSGRPA